MSEEENTPVENEENQGSEESSAPAEEKKSSRKRSSKKREEPVVEKPETPEPSPEKVLKGVKLMASKKARVLRDPTTGVRYTTTPQDVNEVKPGSWVDSQIKAGTLEIYE